MNERVKELLIQQVNKEFYSAYLYLDMANYYHDIDLDGFGNWYDIQAQEERDHALLFIQYLLNNGVRPVLDGIAKPDKVFAKPIDPLVAAAEHERYVTSLIHDIYDAAYSAKDFRTMQFLDWFVKEQGEEEANASDMIKNMELFGSDPKGLYALDREYQARVFVAPTMPM